MRERERQGQRGRERERLGERGTYWDREGQTGRKRPGGSDLDDDGVGGQVDAPGQRGGAAQHLQVAPGEHALHQAAVGSQHARVVDPKTVREELPHLLVPGALDLREGGGREEREMIGF